MEVARPEKGMRVEEVHVARSGGSGGTIVTVTSLPVRVQGSRPARPPRLGEDPEDVGGFFRAKGATSASWAVCVEWDTGVTHIYHARGDRTFNLRLLGGTRRMKGELDGSLREGMVVELSQEGRDWFVTNTPTSVGLGGRGRVLRAFESNCEVLWNNSGVPLRVPNRFLCQRRAAGARRRLGRTVDSPTVRQTREVTTSGGEVAVVHIECGTEGAVIRYAMDKPSAPGLTAGGTASHAMPGHAGWTVYQGPIRLPLEQRGQGLTHDVLLKICATKPGCADSRVIGWVVQKGTIAKWEQPSPIWSTPLNVYQFDTASKFRAWPRPQSSLPGGVLDATSYARQRPVTATMARNRI
uniref:Uncharacterized protein n=2 Tax=Hemiselmis andersenii TaxID=464988 RepID=A0A7S1MYI4_HEMAN|mmetsp:Transcript_7463/g.18073  ORF Transcript_7463/g.18073 Transcript_7463/m.18073 type:complete len:353 (+) Transcript_7463:831-1889(+)